MIVGAVQWLAMFSLDQPWLDSFFFDNAEVLL